MKILICAFVFYSGSILACSCDYDYGRFSQSIMGRAANLIGEISAKDIQVNDYQIKATAMARLDPATYGRRSCGCTSFVKRIWDVSYNQGQKSCEAQVVLNVWNNKMKVTNIVCK